MLTRQDKPLLFATVAVVSILLLSALSSSSSIFYGQKKQQHDSASAPQKESGPMTLFINWSSEDWIAVFTGLAFFVFAGQLWQMCRTNQHFRVTERAYVKLSHEPPGVVWHDRTSGAFQIAAQIKNFGRTPAVIVAVSLRSLVMEDIDSLPEVPPYDRPKRRGAFLPPNEGYTHIADMQINALDRAEVERGTKQLAIVGFVHYRDRFGQMHQAGYGRWYDRRRDIRPEDVSHEDFAGRTNLTYIEDEGYNYDCPVPNG